MAQVSLLTVKKYFPFSEEEIKALTLSILGLAFIISYNDWGGKAFDVLVGLRNFFTAILIVTLSLLVHHSTQRLVGFSVGLKAEYKLWVYGLVIGIALCIVSGGRFWFLAPGGIMVYHMASHRLGSFRYGLNFWPMGMVAWSGCLGSLFLAMVLKVLLSISPGNPALQDALSFNLWFAVVQMLPIPPLNGSHLFFASRKMYVFSVGLILSMAAALYFLGIFLSIIIGLLVGGTVGFLYLYSKESGGH